ncbi:MAG: fibronectin type III domain-containing protein, partial [bacterium]
MERFITSLLILLILILTPLYTQTDSLRISWNPNPESDMLEYRVQRALNGPQNFQLVQTVLHPTTQAVDRSNIQPGNLYSFRLIAVDSAGNQSEPSDTVSVGIPQSNWTLAQIVNGISTSVPLSSFASDPDNSVSELTFIASNQNNISVNRSGNNLILTPNPLTFTGTAGFTLRVEDPAGFWDLESVQLSVTAPVNHPPQITSTPVTVDTVGQLYRYQVTASDPDPGDILSYSLTV